MPRGSLVGDAYVRIHADTTGMHDAIERDMKKIAKSSARSLLTDFDKTLRAEGDARLKGSQRSLATAIIGGDFDRLFKKSGLTVDEFTHKITTDLQKIAQNGKFKGLQKSLDELENWGQRETIFKKLAAEAERLTEHTDRTAVAVHFQNLEMARNAEAVKGTESAWAHYDQRLTAMNKGIFRTLDKAILNQDRAFRSVGSNIRKTIDREATPALLRLGGRFTELHKRTDRAGDSIGKLFGAGSRNNFFNIVGNAAGALFKFGTSFPISIVEHFANGVGGLIKNFNLLKENGATTFGALTKIGGELAVAAIPAVIAFTVAIAALVIALPVIATAISFVVGAITALAASVTIGLIGALLPLIPIVVAVGLAFGGMFLALQGASKKGSEAAKHLASIKASFKDLVTTIRPATDKLFAAFVAAFRPLTKNFLTPVLNDLIGVMAGVVKHLSVIFNSPAQQGFVKTWKHELPIIFKNVGTAISDALGGLFAFFTPILGFSDRLSGSISNVAKKFRIWAESGKGQNSIKTFMDKAYTAATSLFDIIGNLATALGNIFGIANDKAGQSYLTTLDTITKRFADWTGSAKGKNEIADFFKNVSETSGKVGGIISDLSEAFKKLNTKEAKKNLQDFFDALGKISGAIDAISGKVQAVSTALSTIGSIIAAPFVGAGKAIKDAIDQAGGFSGIKDSIGGFFGSIDGWTKDKGQQLRDFFSGLGTKASDAAGKVGGFFTGIGKSVSDGFGTAVTTVSDFFTGVGKSISDGFNSAVTAVSDFFTGLGKGISDGFSTATTAIGNFVTSALQAVGDFGVSLFQSILTVLLFIPALIVTIIGVDTVKSWIDSLSKWVDAAVTWMSSLYTTISTTIINIANSVGTWLSGAVTAVENWGQSIYNTASTWLTGIANNVGTWLSGAVTAVEAWGKSVYDSVTKWVTNAYNSVLTWFTGIANDIGGWISSAIDTVSAWGTRLYNTISTAVQSAVDSVRRKFTSMRDSVYGWISGIVGTVSGVFNRARDGAISRVQELRDKIGSRLSAVAGLIGLWLSGVWSAITQPFRSAYAAVKKIVDDIAALVSRASTLASTVSGKITDFFFHRTAAGGVFYGPTRRLIGEAGPEAVVPLDRPLSLVDPAVRSLSAIAQGKSGVGANVAATSNRSVVVHPGAILIQTATANPFLVAESVLDRLAAAVH